MDKKKATTLIVVIMLFFFLAAKFGFTSYGSTRKVLFSENKGVNSWSADYHLLSGHIKRNMYVGNSIEQIIVDIKTIKGEIGLEIKDKDGDIIFLENNIHTSIFEIEAKGWITIRIDARSHEGGFSVKW